MRGQVVSSEVRLYFNNLSGSASVHEHFAQTVAGYFNSGPIVEVNRKQVRSGDQFRDRDFTFA